MYNLLVYKFIIVQIFFISANENVPGPWFPCLPYSSMSFHRRKKLYENSVTSIFSQFIEALRLLESYDLHFHYYNRMISIYSKKENRKLSFFIPSKIN